MSRPKCCRKIGGVPDINYYKPKGIPSSFLEEVVLTLDEFEAIRLADCEGLYQEQAANKMDISRQTFGRIIDSARGKIADALIHGKALKIEGGEVEIGNRKRFKCRKCNNFFDYSLNTRKPVECPHCKQINSI
jgi:uncharacterized protein